MENNKNENDIFSTVTGVLLDVSGSMKQSYQNEAERTDDGWISSIFDALDSIILHDLIGDHKIFAIAFGGTERPVFDLLGTLE